MKINSLKVSHPRSLQEALQIYARISEMHTLACAVHKHEKPFEDVLRSIEQRSRRVGGEKKDQGREQDEYEIVFEDEDEDGFGARARSSLDIEMFVRPGNSLPPIEVSLAFWVDVNNAFEDRANDRAWRLLDNVYWHLGFAEGILGNPAGEIFPEALNDDVATLEAQLKDALPRALGSPSSGDLRREYLRGLRTGLLDKQRAKNRRSRGKSKGNKVASDNIREDQEAVARLIEEKCPVKGWKSSTGVDVIKAVLPAYRAILKARQPKARAEEQTLLDEKISAKADRVSKLEGSGVGKGKAPVGPKKAVLATEESMDPSKRLEVWLNKKGVVRDAWLKGRSKGS
ncbi:hypothetical protein [Rhodanobacter sp. BL-MT-08]